jgi:hypothetical protein
MTTEEVKNYLSQAYYIDRRIDVLQNELSMLESKLFRCTPSYSNTGSNSSPQPTFEYTIDRVIQYRDRLNTELNNLIDVKKSIKQFIECNLSDNTQKIVLLKRYINYQRYEDIAIDINYSTRQVINIANKGIKNISLNFT